MQNYQKIDGTWHFVDNDEVLNGDDIYNILYFNSFYILFYNHLIKTLKRVSIEKK